MMSLALILASALTVEPAMVRPGQNVKILFRSDAFQGHAVRAHVGFNGWKARGTVDLPLRETAAGFEGTLTVPPEARAMHAAFCKDACGAGDWDNRGGRDFGWPVVFPFTGPVLTWNERTPPESGVVVSFETGGVMPAFLELTAPGEAPQRFESPAADLHRVVLTGLKPATTYRYRVGAAGGLWSEAFTFKTARAPEALTQMRFVVFGDAQDDGVDGRFADLARAIHEKEADADFVIATGDLTANDNPGDWWTFFDRGRRLLASKVMMPAIGNHDTPTVDSSPDHRSFTRYFALPGITADRPFYRFAFGPATFFAMNSERPAELARGGVQYEWLKEKLAQRADGRWRFAYWHIPPFNAGVRHYQQQGQSRALAGMFDGRVDWMFGGHEHIYQRTKPLRDAGASPRIMQDYGREARDGVGYLVVPSSGIAGSSQLVGAREHAAYRERLAHPVLPDTQDAVASWIGYSRVQLDGEQFTLETLAVGPGGEERLVDRVSYRRNAELGR